MLVKNCTSTNYITNLSHILCTSDVVYVPYVCWSRLHHKLLEVVKPKIKSLCLLFIIYHLLFIVAVCLHFENPKTEKVFRSRGNTILRGNSVSRLQAVRPCHCAVHPHCPACNYFHSHGGQPEKMRKHGQKVWHNSQTMVITVLN